GRPAAVFYRLLRVSPSKGGVFCAGRSSRAADDCRLYTDTLTSTRATSYLDSPGPGTWIYRLGVAANWLNDVNYGDVTVVSPPVTVTVP
ncbi:MAG TPA: hypothetical protein VEK39_06980, partial [Solirubrobacterales bacterium]|nr:hypothetical protein [Solirubrobacterales bacterium]